MLHQQDEKVCCLHPQLAAGPPDSQRYRAFSELFLVQTTRRFFGGGRPHHSVLGLEEGKSGKQQLRNIILGKKVLSWF